MSHNLVVKQDVTKTSQNDVEIEMADVNAKYFKKKFDLIQVPAPIGVQEKESIMSVRYRCTNLFLGTQFSITRQSLVIIQYLTLMSYLVGING